MRPDSWEINQWVAQQTNNRIQDLLSPGMITGQMRLVITNTVYFKGDWAQPFAAYETRLEPFQQSEDRSIKMQMMYQGNEKTASYCAFTAKGDLFPTPHEVQVDIKDNDPSLYPDAKGHTMLALDYKAHKIQMIVLLPQSTTGISSLEKSLSHETLQRWIGQLEQRTIHVGIPKFKLESQFELKGTLQSLGMVRCFKNPKDNTEGAQFDKLSSTQRSENRLGISEVMHKTYVDVSEIGTEAAAATSLSAPVGEGDPDTRKTRPFIPVFRANRPFIFLIRDRETASILFMGRYVRPKP